MPDSIDYGQLMHNAMRELIKTVLRDVVDKGLPGEHHFFITFDTTHPDVKLAQWLRDRYPSEMTVVMQHWYDNLEVREDGFAVTLNFGDAPEPLDIPFDALRTFVDPSVEFGLRFEQNDGESEDEHEPHLSSVGTKTDGADKPDTQAAPAGTALAPRAAPDGESRESGGAASAPADKKKDADVVSLDAFRK